MRTAWEIMTGQNGGRVRRWGTPGLDMLGAQAPGERKPRRQRKVRKPAPPKNDFKAYRDRQEMDLLDQINAATGAE